mmetsp:Transcript_105413/g.263854  ORF Transcript_105413/g.263854 Transcript_105413/m.263854 type:complete len:242 (+) Transcript_105413:775-1500(+)
MDERGAATALADVVDLVVLHHPSREVLLHDLIHPRHVRQIPGDLRDLPEVDDAQLGVAATLRDRVVPPHWPGHTAEAIAVFALETVEGELDVQARFFLGLAEVHLDAAENEAAGVVAGHEGDGGDDEGDDEEEEQRDGVGVRLRLAPHAQLAEEDETKSVASPSGALELPGGARGDCAEGERLDEREPPDVVAAADAHGHDDEAPGAYRHSRVHATERLLLHPDPHDYARQGQHAKALSEH